MIERWSRSECRVQEVKVASLCIYEEETGEYRDLCFECGIKALAGRIREPGQNEIVGGWHFTIPDLRSKKHVSINYLPEVVDD